MSEPYGSYKWGFVIQLPDAAKPLIPKILEEIKRIDKQIKEKDAYCLSSYGTTETTEELAKILSKENAQIILLTLAKNKAQKVSLLGHLKPTIFEQIGGHVTTRLGFISLTVALQFDSSLWKVETAGNMDEVEINADKILVRYGDTSVRFEKDQRAVYFLFMLAVEDLNS